jgi:uncharacterized protein YigE (DUF2233 family)
MRNTFLFSILLLLFSCQSEGQQTSTKKKNTPSHSVILDTFKSTPIVSYKTRAEKIKFFLKDDNGNYFNNHGNLKKHLEANGKILKFAMNGGMYLEDSSPQGLFIEQFRIIKKLNKKKASYGNFYMQPNGVFYISRSAAASIAPTSEIETTKRMRFATQSGPMLLINGKMHPKFTQGSKHLHIRNGVGILPNGDVLFAMSKEVINFYDFASYFAKKGCKDALYLDGAISKTYLPEKGIEQTSGKFGVIIAEIK